MIMENGITNDVWFYFLRTLPSFTDMLSTNFSINNLSLNTETNILTIVTNGEHELEANEYVFLQNLLYGYEVSYIKEVETEVNYLLDNYIQFEIPYGLHISNNTVVLLKNFNNTNYNTDFVVYRTEILENGNTLITGKFKDKLLDTTGLDIVNEGVLFLNIQDDMFTSEQKQTTGFATTRVGGAYNGLKIVKEVVDANTFTVDLSVNNNIVLQPDYTSLIDFENAVVKCNLQLFTSTATTDALKNKSAEDLKNQKAVLYLAKQNNLPTLNGFDTRNAQIDPRSAFIFQDEQINFIATLIFRVDREDNNHYILAKQSNQISDHLTRIMRQITGRYFYSENTILTNEAVASTLYKSYWNGSTRVEDLNNIENSVFKSVDFEFKITRQDLIVSNYNGMQINDISFPIKKVINGLAFLQDDQYDTVYE